CFAQLGGFLGGALLEDLLLVLAERFDLLEQTIALLGEQNLLTAKLLLVELAERFLLAEDFVDQGHGDFGFWIPDFGFQSAIRNPKSQMRSSGLGFAATGFGLLRWRRGLFLRGWPRLGDSR